MRGGLTFVDSWIQLVCGRTLAARSGPGELDRAGALLERAHDAATTHGCALIEQRVIQHDEWAITRRYLSEASMAELTQPRDTGGDKPQLEG